MLRSYFLLAKRNLLRSKLFSFINIFGLGIGIAACLMMLLFVHHEFSYDNFHENARNIFSLGAKVTYAGKDNFTSGFTPDVAPTLQAQHHEILATVRVSGSNNHVATGRPDQVGKKFYEDKWLFADSTFLRVFSFKLLSGDPKTALSQVNSVLITPQIAEKYFGSENPIGRTISFFRKPNPYMDSVLVTQEFPLTITGVIEKAPTNTTIDYNFIASLKSLQQIDKLQFQATKPSLGVFNTYLLLKKPQDAGKIAAALDKLIPPLFVGVRQQFLLTSLPDMHLHAPGTNSNLQYLYVFLAIAVLILLLAQINYLSLTTARSFLRVKEIGVRKAIGAANSQVIGQFFGESALTTLLAFGTSILFLLLFFPLYSEFSGIRIQYQYLLRKEFVFFSLLVIILSCLLTGLYPALLMSKVVPLTALRGKFLIGPGGIATRRILTVIQFTVSIALIICTLAIQRQLSSLRYSDLGFNNELLVIPLEVTTAKKYAPLKAEFALRSGASRVAASSTVPFSFQGMMSMVGETNDRAQITLFTNQVDEDFISAFRFKWKQKLPDTDIYSASGKKVVLNEKAVKAFALKSNPLGAQVSIGQEKYLVVGVLKDYNFETLQKDIEPVALFPMRNGDPALMPYGGFISARISSNSNIADVVDQFKQAYGKLETEVPFDYYFLDDAFNSLYEKQERSARLFTAFTMLAVFISCLGLFGLSLYTVERRVREISIRKVFGASSQSIAGLVLSDTVKLVLISFVVATPIAWYLIEKWLQEFAFRIRIEWWFFAVSGFIALFIALATVLAQTVKAAMVNPAKSLRNAE